MRLGKQERESSLTQLVLRWQQAEQQLRALSQLEPHTRAVVAGLMVIADVLDGGSSS